MSVLLKVLLIQIQISMRCMFCIFRVYAFTHTHTHTLHEYRPGLLHVGFVTIVVQILVLPGEVAANSCVG